MQNHFLPYLVIFGIFNWTVGDTVSSKTQNDDQGEVIQVNVRDELNYLRGQLRFETTMRMQFDQQFTAMSMRFRTLLEEQAKAKEQNENLKRELREFIKSSESKEMGLETCIQKFGQRSDFALLVSNERDNLLADLQRNISLLEELMNGKSDERSAQDVVFERMDTSLKKIKREMGGLQTKLLRIMDSQNTFARDFEQRLREISKDILALNNSVGSCSPSEMGCRTEFEDSGIRDCGDVKVFKGQPATDGLYDIWPDGKTKKKVLCQMKDDGWTVFQRRQNGKVNFRGTWQDYKDGFGSPESEYWLGNEHIHLLTLNRTCRLRIEMENWNRIKAHAEYKDFSLGTEEDAYILNIGKYSGTAGRDSLGISNSYPFSTWDRDHDGWDAGNCAVIRSGAWWYRFYWCSYSNLNGDYNKTHDGSGVWWYSYPLADNMKTTKMMLLCS